MSELITASHAHQLVKYDEMCRAIDAVYEVDEVKDLRDKAYALEAYFRQAKNPEPERRACEIRLRAERRAGQLLLEMEKNPGARGNPGGQGAPIASSQATRAQTLSNFGITYDQSSKWQQLADVPQEEFDAALVSPDKPSISSILKPRQSPMNPRALWLWGRLRDFEREAMLTQPIDELLYAMTEGMQADVRRLAPLVSQWLQEVNDEKE